MPNLTSLHFSAQIEHNVAINHKGPCFTLWEGGEKHNVLRGNLGALTYKDERTGKEGPGRWVTGMSDWAKYGSVCLNNVSN